MQTSQGDVARMREDARVAIREHLFTHRGKCECGVDLTSHLAGAQRVDPDLLADHMAAMVIERQFRDHRLVGFPVVADRRMPEGTFRLVSANHDQGLLWGVKFLDAVGTVIQCETQLDATTLMADNHRRPQALMHRATPDEVWEEVLHYGARD